MQTKLWSLRDVKNKFNVELDIIQSISFADHLLSMPADGYEFDSLELIIRDFDVTPQIEELLCSTP